MQPPTYPSEAVQPFRNELTAVGFKELLSPEDVDQAVKLPGLTLCMINSVCGCAAGAARPGVGIALQHKTIPDHLVTVFAGMERDAVDRVRSHHAEIAPPSSPSMVLFKEGKCLGVVHRHDIEGRSAQQLAEGLTQLFDQHATKAGPSIPPEKFSQLTHIKACGSQIPRVG